MERLTRAWLGARAYNPLRMSGTGLPPQLLLMAKLIAIAYLLRGGIVNLSVPFLPFVPWLDLAPRAILARGLQAAFLIALAALLTNRRVRTASFVLGAVILVAILASRPYYQNNRMFAGSVLLLAGLYRPGLAGQLVRYQLVLLYAAAAANKLLDPNWRSGQFFAAWTSVSDPGAASFLAAHLPTGAAFFVMSWLVMATELAIAAAFVARRWFGFGIWLAVAYHTALLFVAGRTFGVFWFALLSSFLALAFWPPAEGAALIPDGGRTQALLGRLLRWVDVDGGFTWRTLPGGRVRLEAPGRKASEGWAALLDIAASLPAVYLALLLLAVRLPEALVRIPALAVVLVLGVAAFRYLGRFSVELRTRYRRRPLVATSRA